MITKKSLGIFWKFKEGLQEVDGIYFYGLWKHSMPKNLNLEGINDLWYSGEIEYKIIKCDGDDYKVFSITFYIKKFPDAKYWISNLKSVLSWLNNSGAFVSWCGAEDCSPNPDIFNKKRSSGNIYACYSNKTNFMCNSGLHDELKYLNDNQLDDVWGLIKGEISI